MVPTLVHEEPRRPRRRRSDSATNRTRPGLERSQKIPRSQTSNGTTRPGVATERYELTFIAAYETQQELVANSWSDHAGKHQESERLGNQGYQIYSKFFHSDSVIGDEKSERGIVCSTLSV